MSLTNRYGDAEITDPRTMRALAHPGRLAILENLQRLGPSTATELAPLVGASPSVVSWHLRHLGGFGLVEDAPHDGDRRLRRWKASAPGYRLALEGDDETLAAARVLHTQHVERGIDMVRHWEAEIEPTLPPEWRRLAGQSNTGISITPDELAELQDAIEELLAPYVHRKQALEEPEGAGRVRVLWHVLPGA